MVVAWLFGRLLLVGLWSSVSDKDLHLLLSACLRSFLDVSQLSVEGGGLWTRSRSWFSGALDSGPKVSVTQLQQNDPTETRTDRDEQQQ